MEYGFQGQGQLGHCRQGASNLSNVSVAQLNTKQATYVVIVTYQGSNWIERCLDSLHGSSCIVVVVDNGSTDDTLRIISNQFPEVERIAIGLNLGFGAANNIGIRFALDRGAEYIFLLNQDAFVVGDTIQELTRYMERYQTVGVLSPLHCTLDTKALDQKTLRVYLSRHFQDYLSDACFGRTRESYCGYGVNAAAWFVRSDVFERFGGFDPLFFMYGEDDDLLARWQYHGVLFHLLPGARIIHLRESPTMPSSSNLDEVLRYSRRRRSSLLVRLKNPGRTHFGAIALWASRGFLEPLQSFLERRDTRALMGELIAALILLTQWSRIRKHMLLTCTHGAHFLERDGMRPHIDQSG